MKTKILKMVHVRLRVDNGFTTMDETYFNEWVQDNETPLAAANRRCNELYPKKYTDICAVELVHFEEDIETGLQRRLSSNWL